MQTFDTNVVIRIILGDDEQQTELAVRQWREALQQGGVFLPMVVIIEVSWVLARAAKLSRERILSELHRLTILKDVYIENSALIRQAIELYKDSPADFGDCVVLASALINQAVPVYTFDRGFARHAEVNLITGSMT